jgi:hypothetical protein
MDHDESVDEFILNKKLIKDKRELKQQKQQSSTLVKQQPFPLPQTSLSSQLQSSAVSSQGDDKPLKLTQISRYLSPAASRSEESKEDLQSTKDVKLSLFKLNETQLFDTNLTVERKPQKPAAKPSRVDKPNSGISKYFGRPSNDSENGQIREHGKEETFKCPICLSNLSGFGEHERHEHVNRCLDKSACNEETSKQKIGEKPEPQPCANDDQSSSSSCSDVKSLKSLLESAVPNCPICGKVLHSLSVRIFYICLLLFELFEYNNRE